MAGVAAAVALCAACGGEDDGGPVDCRSLDRAACEAEETCLALMAWDVTSTDGGGAACWRGPGWDWGEQEYLRCILRPAITSGAPQFAYDSDSDRCYAFTSPTIVPSGWRDCRDVLVECTCRDDADCPDDHSCIYYGEHEQACRPPRAEAVACAYEPFPVTGDPCAEADREVVCRPYFCDEGCAPTCRCTAGSWECEAERCVEGGSACGEPPACACL